MTGMVLAACVAVGAVLVVHVVDGLLFRDPVLRTLPYQSGGVPDAHALSRFHVRWYPATLVFLAVDVEMLFMYPWVLVVADLGIGAVVEMFLFLGVLAVAVAWAWREGAFRWV
ncbi:NADH-quinone oxidoreductase subunit A [Phycicoccus sp. BSK3Z-2]|uniref:NADH-quinone oxidoreductase subunit n=1 Tax=Phycicoccus avicenniae TaxID=2828860 RepID=A0A941D6B3_9MICO|nr:NADH-quinone oxidoreductase subunit A [Phycicoccus avicenniae]MBR7742426.1 NADH-quinone oxidoreductase subunit A [Phycicoccus avicenniae]